MQGEEAEEAERTGGDEAADFGGVNRVKISILDICTHEGALSKGSIELFLKMASMETREIDKMKVKAGLGPGGDDEEGDKGQGEGAVPKQADDDQNKEKTQAMKEFPVVGVLHFPHAPKLF